MSKEIKSTSVKNGKEEVKRKKPVGIIEHIFLHPVKSNDSMIPVPHDTPVELVANRGIKNNNRHFKSGVRQISLIHVDLIRQLQKEITEEFFAPENLLVPGIVRSDLEISGDFNLLDYLDQELIIGDPDDPNSPIVVGTIARVPCHQMDFVYDGLMPLMKDGRQGIFVRVLRGGFIRAGDTIQRISDEPFVPVVKEIIFDERYATKPRNFGVKYKKPPVPPTPKKSSTTPSKSSSVPVKSTAPSFLSSIFSSLSFPPLPSAISKPPSKSSTATSTVISAETKTSTSTATLGAASGTRKPPPAKKKSAATADDDD